MTSLDGRWLVPSPLGRGLGVCAPSIENLCLEMTCSGAFWRVINLKGVLLHGLKHVL